MVQDIYSTIVLKDVVERNSIRSVDLLDRVVEYLLRNVGNIFSAKKIHDYFKSELRSVSIDTILDYLKYLTQAFFIEKVPRYDVLGKKVLSVNEKYYIADISFINQVAGYDDRLIPGILENIVYLELRRRGYEVFIGQLNNKEVDFVAEKAGEKIYIQVAYLLKGNEQAIEREFGSLLMIKDQYPKYVVSLDSDFSINYEGIRHKNIVDFLVD
jgi:predicted AAA+ superfamily ATPase